MPIDILCVITVEIDTQNAFGKFRSIFAVKYSGSAGEAIYFDASSEYILVGPPTQYLIKLTKKMSSLFAPRSHIDA